MHGRWLHGLEGITVVHAPTENPSDADFLAECGPWLDHPRSWSPNLRFYPDKIARVFEAIAAAESPVLVHCAGGRDRTGMIGSMLLALAGPSMPAPASGCRRRMRRGAGANSMQRCRSGAQHSWSGWTRSTWSTTCVMLG